MSSGTFRGTGHLAKAPEWLAMTGACETRSASAIVSGETCEMSTSMPSRFISRTTRSPKGERPPLLGVSVAASAQSSVALCVSVMYRAPSLANARSCARSFSIATPPSIPISDAIFPALTIRSTSSAERASSNVVGIARDHPVDQVDLPGDASAPGSVPRSPM